MTATAKHHTPGPWGFEQTNGGTDQVFQIRSVHGDIQVPQHWVAECSRYADAALIAASPELLEALKGCLLAMANDPATNWDTAIEFANAAIAKAESR